MVHAECFTDNKRMIDNNSGAYIVISYELRRQAIEQVREEGHNLKDEGRRSNPQNSEWEAIYLFNGGAVTERYLRGTTHRQEFLDITLVNETQEGLERMASALQLPLGNSTSSKI